MIIHVFVDIPQEARGDDTHTSRGNARQIDVLIALPRFSSAQGPI